MSSILFKEPSSRGYQYDGDDDDDHAIYSVGQIAN